MFTLYNVLLTLHVLTAIMTIGWLSMQAMLMPRAIRSGNASVVRFGASMAERIGPIAAVVFLLGLWLIPVSSNAAIKDRWVKIAMVLFIVALVNGAVFIGRAEKSAAGKLEAGQAAPGEAKRVAMLGGLNALILLTIVFLMFAKPR